LLSCAQASRPTGPAARAVPVTVGLVAQKDFPVELTAIGHAESYQTAAVKPQVQGQLESVLFTPGQDVKAGAELFRIDPRAYEAALGKSEAILAKDQALETLARSDEAKTAELVKTGYDTQEQLDTAHANAQALKSQVDADRAQVDNDRLQLAYCTITAPISGRTGALQVDVGNIVSANSTVLVTINRLSPIYVSFSVPEGALAEVKRFSGTAGLRVQARVPGDGAAALEGRLVFIDNAVDSSTGTVLLKASFDNADGRLWPGQYANLMLTLNTERNATVIPTQALQTGQGGQFVFVVKGDRTVEMRPVTVARTIGSEAAIAAGLRPGETVVTDGQLLLVPGAPVEIRDAARTAAASGRS
ncbi:MAG TPA: efflux RND transporter periplasmic adaptor subunit, partial [Rectinemataceae bacterium]|nr:efflux RND transporter periplasmic adaptor subunit [Rectinemataceae bacterium]